MKTRLSPCARRRRAVFLEQLETRTHFAANLRLNATQVVLNDVRGGGASPAVFFSFTNTGDKTFTVNSIAISGTRADNFAITSGGVTSPINIKAGRTYRVGITFSAPTNAATGVRAASLQISSTAPNALVAGVALRGLVTRGLESSNEPSLQHILDTYQIPVNVGDATPDETRLTLPPRTPNDEITAQTFVSAGAGAVTMEPIAVFVPNFNPVITVGTYNTSTQAKTQLWTVDSGSFQTLNLATTGTKSFSPGSAPFGLYATIGFNGKTGFSQDVFNEPGVANQRLLRTYPMKTTDGRFVQYAYVIGNEATTDYSDQQDVVYIMRGVKPTGDVTAPASPLSLSVVSNVGDASLNWADSVSSDLAGYNIRRSTNSKRGFVLLNSDALVSDSSFVDTSAGLKRYYYRISAVDKSGNESDVSKITVKVVASAGALPASVSAAKLANVFAAKPGVRELTGGLLL